MSSCSNLVPSSDGRLWVGHGRQAVAPAAGAYPAPQEQPAQKGAVLPSAHAMQTDAPARELKLPAAHSEHAVAPWPE